MKLKPETVIKIGDRAKSVLEKHLTKKLVKMDLDGQAKTALRLFRLAVKMKGYAGKVQYRALFLKDFPGDLAVLREQGMTDAEITTKYWSCKRFVTLWTEMDLNEDNFQTMLKELPE